MTSAEATFEGLLEQPLMQRQMELEDLAIAESARRMEHLVASLSERHNKAGDKVDASLSRTPAAVAILLRALEPVTKVLEADRAAALTGKPGRRNATMSSLVGIDLKDAALVTLKHLLDGMQRPRKIQSAAMAIGHAVFHEAGLQRWVREDPKQVKALLPALRGTASEAHHSRIMRAFAARFEVDLGIPGMETRFAVGAYLTHRICEITGFFEVVHKIEGKNNSPQYVQPTARLVRWAAKHYEALAVMNPVSLPLLIPPRRWTKESRGGWHFAGANRLPFVAGFADAGTDKALQALCGEVPFAAINHLQETGWRINRQVLDVLQSYVRNASQHVPGIGRLVEQDIPSHPDLPVGTQWTQQEQLRHDQWVRRAAAIHEENVAVRRKLIGPGQRERDASGFGFGVEDGGFTAPDETEGDFSGSSSGGEGDDDSGAALL